MIKNLPVRSVSLLVALLAALIITAVIYFFCFITITYITLFSITAIFILCFATVYFVCTFFLKKYFAGNLRQILQNISEASGIKPEVAKGKLKDEKIISQIGDVVEKWKSEQEKEIEKLKKLETYRNEFLGNVSHELKTPIFSTQGFVHTLIDGGINDPSVNKLYLNKASKSLDRLISIVDDLDSISKLDAGKLLMEMQVFDICELAKDVIDSLEMEAKEKNIRLSIRDSSDKPVPVNADKERIRQVLVNLLVNSIKYGKQGGSTEINFSERADVIITDISDNGIGIAKEHLPRLFERFYRIDKSRSREEGGTGLGLAIVKHILDAHHQKISVTSEFGYGTIFSFTLDRGK